MNFLSYRIFAIDDIVDNLFLLQTFLEIEGFSVEVADRAKIALQRIQADPPDLILLDLMMPDLSGYEVIQRIRQNPQLTAIPIILISANDRTQALEGLELGANDFIQKPIDLEELQTKVKQVLQSTKAKSTKTHPKKAPVVHPLAVHPLSKTTLASQAKPLESVKQL